MQDNVIYIYYLFIPIALIIAIICVSAYYRFKKEESIVSEIYS